MTKFPTVSRTQRNPYLRTNHDADIEIYEPAYQVVVRVTDPDQDEPEALPGTITFSARTTTEAKRIVNAYSDDCSIKVVPRGAVADAIQWTQPGQINEALQKLATV